MRRRIFGGELVNHVALHPYVSLFSGAGGLDLAVRLALPIAQCRLYVENEVSAARILAARIAEGSIDDAPIWSDVRTVPCDLYRGRVAGIVGGFPCVDLSVAGRQAGITGEHSGLWFEYARIVREVQPEWVFIENVPPVLHAGNGGAVLGELAELGFDAEWGTLSAAAVGASHLRKRVFFLAYRAGRGLRELRESYWGNGFADGRGADVEGPARHVWNGSHGEGGRRRGVRETSSPMVNPERAERWPHINSGGNGEPRRDGEGEAASGAGERGEVLGHADERHDYGTGDTGARRRGESANDDGELGNPISAGLEIGRCEPGDDGSECAAAERAGEPLGIFAPGPTDPRWKDVLVRNFGLRPALAQAEAEPIFRELADGLADLVDGARTDALRAIGNGVVPLQAAAMLLELIRRAR